jgi:hypothetical protein
VYHFQGGVARSVEGEVLITFSKLCIKEGETQMSTFKRKDFGKKKTISEAKEKTKKNSKLFRSNYEK